MTDLLADIADTADELTNPRQNVERIQDTDRSRNKRVRRVWVAVLPSLLDQLARAVQPGESYSEEEAGRTAFESRPAARLDAVDRLVAIEAGAAGWCTRSGVELRDSPAGNIRSMVGAAPSIGSDNQSMLLGDLRAWRTWAATVTGWERPADAPRASCPHCGKINVLRVRLARKTACCLSCGAWWDDTTIGILAEHIRATFDAKPDTNHLRTAAVQARREWEARRLALATPTRPRLPYVDDLTDVRI